MALTRQAWIIAPEGPGTGKDRTDLTAWLDRLPEAQRPAWVAMGADPDRTLKPATSQRVFDTLDDLTRHQGLRWVWIVGHTFTHRNKLCLQTDDFEDPARLTDLGDLLKAAAETQPHAPLVAVVDVCRAGAVWPTDAVPDNLALFLASDADKRARADKTGGWLTQRLLAALQDGARTVRELEDAVEAARAGEQRGDQHPRCFIGQDVRTVELVPAAPLPSAPTPAPQDLGAAACAAWRNHMARTERYLVPLFGHKKRAVDDVYVELAVGDGQGMPPPSCAGPTPVPRSFAR